jgi:signal transduction histidine kinase
VTGTPVISRWRERLRHTLGFRLALWYALVFVASSLALVVLTYVLLAASLRQYDREIIEGMLVRFASAYARGGVYALEREMEQHQLATDPGPVFVRTVGRRQDLVFLSIPEAWRGFDLSQLAAPSLSGEQTWATLETGDDGEVLEVASVRLADGTLFQVGKSMARRRDLLARFRQVLLFDLGSILVIALVGGAVLTWSALQPVRTLAGTVRGIMRTGRTDVRVPVTDDTGDALGELSVLVNAMLDRIDTVIAGMRGALDNVAHDLRTPMARLRGIAETALASHDPVVLREALADCLEESDRVIATLHTLMDISEAETGTMALRLEAVDLRDLVRQSVELYEDLADERGLELLARLEQPVEVRVDRNRVRQALANLIDNALKYTDRGGRVEIAAVRDGREVVVTVADTGMGIAPDDLPHIWDRLYRADRSRTTRGLGLGLTLVRAIAQAHGGSVAVESAPGAGSRFHLRLPLSTGHGGANLTAM